MNSVFVAIVVVAFVTVVFAIWTVAVRARAVRQRRRHPEVPRGSGLLVGFPARNEARTVGLLVERTLAIDELPRPLTVLVVDDGSTDDTATVARNAGAVVVTMPTGVTGLGAGVRRILAEAVERDAAFVAFLDADGEYRPENLPGLLAPVAAGSASYVLGNRFSRGSPDGMPAWRNVGNRLGSVLVSLLVGCRIRDAQSGLRLLGRRAAESAEINHDYNYAQVLTISLARQGFELAQPAIGYCRRSSGRTFVRLPTYLRRVVPAIARARFGRIQSSTVWSAKRPSPPLHRTESKPAVDDTQAAAS